MTRMRAGDVLCIAALLLLSPPSRARAAPDSLEAEALKALESRIAAAAAGPMADSLKGRPATPAERDIRGPGAVLRVGNVVMKVTNGGVIGNPFTNLSSDPAGQWPGASGVEYLNFIYPVVSAVNPLATTSTTKRRVSFQPEWWPPTADPVDRMYRGYDGSLNGARLANDDQDLDPLTGKARIDEDFLDGRDNDGDGAIDEDYGALGQAMYTCVMRDDTPAALVSGVAERHVPLVLEVRQTAWAYSVPGFTDFNPIQWDVYNRSGHTLDSLYFGLYVDVDAGPISNSTYYAEDRDLPYFPSGEFRVPVSHDDPRFQYRPATKDALCPEMRVRIHGFSVADNDGDGGRTPGVSSILLFSHTTDPLGLRAPRRIGFRAFRSYTRGTPFSSNGAPTIDQQAFEFMSSTQNIDPETGRIAAEPGEQDGDYRAWASVGPFLSVPDGGMISCTFGVAVGRGSADELRDYRSDYRLYEAGLMSLQEMFQKYPALENAFRAQMAYEGVYELPRPGFEDQVPNCHGCETPVRLPAGSTPEYLLEVCPGRGEPTQKLVTDRAYTWFDFDCDLCTGVYDERTRRGYFLRHWNAESPPPNPNLNVSSLYNYSDSPNRVVPAGDNQITLAWDNISETTPDPKIGQFDFRSYRVWKVAGWRRPVGSSGPNDEDWSLMSELRLFDHADSNFARDPTTDTLICPRVLVPNHEYPPGHPHCSEPGTRAVPLARGGCRDTATVGICLRKGDFWDRQTGFVMQPLAVECARNEAGECLQYSGRTLKEGVEIQKTRYLVGRYRIVDREVKNGFGYFYSVTAGDSTSGGELFGRRSAVEADLVVPQSSVGSGNRVWVVPNPYRGFRNILERPSAWDLTPNATDPTGTHIDFMGLPAGAWRIRIYTVSGDLVAELHHTDSVNDATRRPVTGSDGKPRPGFNRQQDHPNDGQARWNLISRNGQDVVSGIYLFVVESDQGQQRGKFVIAR